MLMKFLFFFLCGQQIVFPLLVMLWEVPRTLSLKMNHTLQIQDVMKAPLKVVTIRMHSVYVQRKQQQADSMLSVNKKSFDETFSGCREYFTIQIFIS